LKKNRYVLATLVPGRTEQFPLNVSIFSEDQPVEFTVTGSGEVHLVGTLELLPSPYDGDEEDDESDLSENGFLDQEASDGEDSDEGARVTELRDDDDEEEEEDEEDDDDEDEEEEEEEPAHKGKHAAGKPHQKPQAPQQAALQQAGKKNKEAPAAHHEQSVKKQKGESGKPQPSPQQQQQKPQTPKPDAAKGQKTPNGGQQTPKVGQQTPKGGQQTPKAAAAQTPKSAEKPVSAGAVQCPECPAKFNNPTALTQHTNAKHKKATA